MTIDYSDDEFIAAFERLYDASNGSWHLPGLFLGEDRFRPDVVDEWLKLPTHAAPVEKEVGDFLAALVAMHQPSYVLETGTNMGYSTAKIANTLAKLGGERRLFTIDPIDNNHLFNEMRCAGLVTYFCGLSTDVHFPEIPLDMLFLDSDHHYGTIASEIARFEPMLKRGGLIVFHDTVFYDAIGLAVRQLASINRFETVTIASPRVASSRCAGLTIARKIRTATRDSERFIPDALLAGVEVNLDISRHGDPSWIIDYP